MMSATGSIHILHLSAQALEKNDDIPSGTVGIARETGIGGVSRVEVVWEVRSAMEVRLQARFKLK
jgi:hypothetical protein